MFDKYLYRFLIFTLLISSCVNKLDSPEEVLEQYENSLSGGDCDRAIELSIGEANDGAKREKAEGCIGWKQEVLSVSCEEMEDIATCQIRLRKESILSHPAGTYNYTYSMKKVNDNWKVWDFWKSLNIPEERYN